VPSNQLYGLKLDRVSQPALINQFPTYSQSPVTDSVVGIHVNLSPSRYIFTAQQYKVRITTSTKLAGYMPVQDITKADKPPDARYLQPANKRYLHHLCPRSGYTGIWRIAGRVRGRRAGTSIGVASSMCARISVADIFYFYFVPEKSWSP
jgi:hypothetical protein